MEGNAVEETRFQFISPDVLAIAGKKEHAQYFKDVGLFGFVSQVPWKNQDHNTADMLELIRNFDRNLAKSVVKGVVVSFSVDSMKSMFRLEDGGQADEKMSNYAPKTFSYNDRGKSNCAYPLLTCKDDLVKERLEFQLVTLHMKGRRVETVALYQIQQVEECVHANWGKCFASRLVEVICKAQENIFRKKGKATCSFASHLQVILSKAVSPTLPASLFQVTTLQQTFGQPGHAEQGRHQAPSPKHCAEVVEVEVDRDHAWTSTLMHPSIGQPNDTERARQQASCSAHCREIVEDLKKDHASMTGRHRNLMTTTVGELRKEMGTLKALYESLAKEVYQCRIKHSEDKADGVRASVTNNSNSANPPYNEVATVANTIPLSGVEDKRVENSALPLCVDDKDNEDDCNGKSAKSAENKAMDSRLQLRSAPSLVCEDNPAQCDDKVTNSKEISAIAGTGVLMPSPATKANCSLPVKRIKLQQQKLNLPGGGGSTYKPQSVKRRLDMNMKTDPTNSQQRKARRVRRKWSKAETDYLVSAVKRYGEKWSVIAVGGSGILENRTGGDCKDRWRNVTDED